MRFTGKLLPPTIDFETRKINAVFALNEDFTQAYEELKDCDKITLEVKKYRAKRSLDANAYYWTLIYKLAKVLQITNEECHNMELRHYGQPEIYEGKGVYITIPDTPEAEKKVDNSMDYHLAPTTQVRVGNDGVIYRTYRLLRGSHSYTTQEMARLIDGVINDCRDANIPDAEIASPEEARILKERYGVNV